MESSRAYNYFDWKKYLYTFFIFYFHICIGFKLDSQKNQQPTNHVLGTSIHQNSTTNYRGLKIYVTPQASSAKALFDCKRCIPSRKIDADVIVVNAFQKFSSQKYSVGFFWESIQHYPIIAETNITWSYRADSTISNFAMIANKELKEPLPFLSKKKL